MDRDADEQVVGKRARRSRAAPVRDAGIDAGSRDARAALDVSGGLAPQRNISDTVAGHGGHGRLLREIVDVICTESRMPR